MTSPEKRAVPLNRKTLPQQVFDSIATEQTKTVFPTVTEGGDYIDEATDGLNVDHPVVAHDLEAALRAGGGTRPAGVLVVRIGRS